jgi:hypothetical protein
VPRQNRRRTDDVPLRSAGSQRHEQWRGVEYLVRAVPSTAAVKAYRCPGCDQLVAAGVAHVVAWPAEDLGADNRRHWHVACWSARDRRAPTRRTY